MKNKNHLRLGDILINAKKIEESHLEEAIEKQSVFKKRIGEIFIMMGLLNPEELELYLTLQKSMARKDSKDIKTDLELIKKMEVIKSIVKPPT